jgi:hypothetical protein
MKTVLYILIGAVGMFLILKVMSTGKPIAENKTTEDLKKFLQTKEANELLQTEQFAAVLLTPEFRNLMKDIADVYINELTKNLIQ